MKYSVDRISGDKALLISEGRVRRIVASSMLPEGTKEGSFVIEEQGVFKRDRSSENALRRKLYALQEKLKSRTPAQKKR